MVLRQMGALSMFDSWVIPRSFVGEALTSEDCRKSLVGKSRLVKRHPSEMADAHKDNHVITSYKSVKLKSRKRYYVRYSVVPFEEDFTHEFKGHRNLCMEDLPVWSYQSGCGRRTRRPISRALCAFLNTTKGGTVYLGIVDDGTVKGIRLTQYQKDHIVLGIEDVLSRFNPPVPKHMWHLEFVPIVDKDCLNLSEECSPEASADVLNDSRRLKPHVFRTKEYCWCDKDAVAQFNVGVVMSDYVIEVTIHSYDISHPQNEQLTKADLKLPPIFENEEGRAFFRRQASLFTYTMQEITELTKQQVRDYYQPIVDKLRHQLCELRQQAE